MKRASEENDNGVRCYRAKEWASAIRHFEEALRIVPAYPDAKYNLERARAKQKKFEAELEEIRGNVQIDKSGYNRQLQRLMNEVSRIEVPPPAKPRRVHEGLMLGLFDLASGVPSKYGNVKSPFTGKPYDADEILATTDSDNGSEIIRGVLDNHYLGEYTLAGAYGDALIERLKGVHFDRLIAHSNGATIAEALIRKGVITVNELNVVGGDRSTATYVGLQELLASGRVQRVVIWINPGDIIPMGSSSTLLSPFGPTGSVPLVSAAQFVAGILAGDTRSADAQVEPRLLAGAGFAGQQMRLDRTFMDAHDLINAYLPNMARYLSAHAEAADEQPYNPYQVNSPKETNQ